MQMAKWIVAFLLVGLVACGENEQQSPTPPQDDNHGYGYTYNYSNASGLRMRGYDVKSSLFSFYETAWDEMIACTGLPATSAPLIIIVDYDNADLDDPAEYGHTFIDTGTILSGKATEQSIRHSMLHVLLKNSSFDDDQNMAHAFHASYMARCGYRG